MIGIVFLITLSLSSCKLTSPAQPISLKKLENFWSTWEMRLFSGSSHLQQKTQDIHMCIQRFLKMQKFVLTCFSSLPLVCYGQWIELAVLSPVKKFSITWAVSHDQCTHLLFEFTNLCSPQFKLFNQLTSRHTHHTVKWSVKQ